MDDHQRSDGIPVTRFTLQSIYAQSEDEKLQFEYESGNINILKNDDLKKKMEDERVAVKAQRAADIVACVKHSMTGWSLLLRIILPERPTQSDPGLSLIWH
ncbi:hypothetical protein Tco_1397491 [Tanacetum coccineum]